MDPRIGLWSAHVEWRKRAFVQDLGKDYPEEAQQIKSILAERQKPPSPEAFIAKIQSNAIKVGQATDARDAILEKHSAQNQELREAFERAGAWTAWCSVLREHYDEAILRLSPGLDISEHAIVGVDGNIIPMCFIRPQGSKCIPCVYYIHGGGMSKYSSRDGDWQAFGRLIARQGVAVCLVEFRNALEPTIAVQEVAAYPAGLDDCYYGLEWLHANRAKLNITDAICVAGESGGANLSFAVALRAKRCGQLHMIPSGVFAMCPFIAGCWPQDVKNNGILGVSHVENGSAPPGMAMATVYGISAFEAQDPLAWVGFATSEELRGLPRAVISVNEGDVFRDEGVLLYRRCLHAGMPTQCRMVMGTLHANDMHWHMLPDVALATARAMADFAANDFPLERLPMPLPMPTPKMKSKL